MATKVWVLPLASTMVTVRLSLLVSSTTPSFVWMVAAVAFSPRSAPVLESHWETKSPASEAVIFKSFPSFSRSCFSVSRLAESFPSLPMSWASRGNENAASTSVMASMVFRVVFIMNLQCKNQSKSTI